MGAQGPAHGPARAAPGSQGRFAGARRLDSESSWRRRGGLAALSHGSESAAFRIPASPCGPSWCPAPPPLPRARRERTWTVPAGFARGADLAVSCRRRTTAVVTAKKTSSTAAGPSLADVSKKAVPSSAAPAGGQIGVARAARGAGGLRAVGRTGQCAPFVNGDLALCGQILLVACPTTLASVVLRMAPILGEPGHTYEDYADRLARVLLYIFHPFFYALKRESVCYIIRQNDAHCLFVMKAGNRPKSLLSGRV
jgi:hypothetical protein